MSGAAEGDDGLHRYDGPCEVCGESVLGREYMALGLGGIFTEEGDGVGWSPEADPSAFSEWGDVPQTLCVHRECMDHFFDGAVVKSAHNRRRGE